MLKGNVVENYEAVGYTELGWNSGSIPPWGGVLLHSVFNCGSRLSGSIIFVSIRKKEK